MLFSMITESSLLFYIICLTTVIYSEGNNYWAEYVEYNYKRSFNNALFYYSFFSISKIDSDININELDLRRHNDYKHRNIHFKVLGLFYVYNYLINKVIKNLDSTFCYSILYKIFVNNYVVISINFGSDFYSKSIKIINNKSESSNCY